MSFPHIATGGGSTPTSLVDRGIWSSAGTYNTDDTVIHGNTIWLAKRDNTNVEPGTSADDWTAVGTVAELTLTASRPATAADSGKTYTNADGSNVYITVEAGMPRGFKLTLIAGKTGSIGAIAGSGVTFTGDVPLAVLAGQIITIEWTAADTYAVSVGMPSSVAGGITPSLTMSRTGNGIDNPEMWVAPCGVQFNATGTTKTGETNPFRNLFYSIDYGDHEKANEFWPLGALPGKRSKNKDVGPIGAHVYENPGTYTVTLTVMDTSFNIATTQQTITVTDPDIVFGAANTTYVSAIGDFSGTLEGATKLTQSNITETVFDNFASGKRILLKGGENYTLDGNKVFSLLKNCQVGVYGSGLANITFTGTGTIVSTFGILTFRLLSSNGDPSQLDNIQVFGLKITNSSASALHGISMSNFGVINSPHCEYGRMTVHNCQIDDSLNDCYHMEGYGHVVSESIGLMRTTAATGNGAVGVWGKNSNTLSIMGCKLDNQNKSEHGTRLQGGDNVFSAHNEFLNPAPTKVCYTVRGYTPVTTQAITWAANTARAIGDYRVMSSAPGKVFRVYGVTGSRLTGASEPAGAATANMLDLVVDNQVTWRYEFDDTLPYAYTAKNLYVYDNYFAAENVAGDVNILTQVEPQNSTTYEPRENVLWSNNRYGKTLGSSTQTVTKLTILANNVTIRNNIADMSDQADAYITKYINVSGANSATPPVPACSDVLVENNSFFSDFVGLTSNNKVFGVTISASATSEIVVRNNLGYAPNSKIGSTMVSDTSMVATISNNSSDIQLRSATSPYSVATPSTPDGFKLVADSYVIGAGVSSDGAFIDYFGTTRSRLVNPDIGAVDSTS